MQPDCPIANTTAVAPDAYNGASSEGRSATPPLVDTAWLRCGYSFSLLLFVPQVGLELCKYRQHVEERLSSGGVGVVSIGWSEADLPDLCVPLLGTTKIAAGRLALLTTTAFFGQMPMHRVPMMRTSRR
jgi:hypothetical protein